MSLVLAGLMLIWSVRSLLVDDWFTCMIFMLIGVLVLAVTL